MCIYLNTANVYIRRIYDTLETILRKMLTFRSATTNYSDKIFAGFWSERQRLMHASPVCTGAARCTSAQPRGPGTVRSSLLTKMVMILYIVVSLILFVNVLFRNDDGKEWPGVRQQERPVAGLSGGELRGWRDNHGEYSVTRIFYINMIKLE